VHRQRCPARPRGPAASAKDVAYVLLLACLRVLVHATFAAEVAPQAVLASVEYEAMLVADMSLDVLITL
jgi:hypothetical protein